MRSLQCADMMLNSSDSMVWLRRCQKYFLEIYNDISASVTGTSMFLSSLTHISLGAPHIWTPLTRISVQKGDNYQGCIGNLSINGDRVNLNQDSRINQTELGTLLDLYVCEYCYTSI